MSVLETYTVSLVSMPDHGKVPRTPDVSWVVQACPCATPGSADRMMQ